MLKATESTHSQLIYISELIYTMENVQFVHSRARLCSEIRFWWREFLGQRELTQPL